MYNKSSKAKRRMLLFYTHRYNCAFTRILVFFQLNVAQMQNSSQNPENLHLLNCVDA